MGNAHPISAPMDSFAASDGHVVIAVANDALFSRLAAAIGHPDLAQEARFSTDAARFSHQEELRALIEVWTETRPVAEIVEYLEAAGVPAAPIWDLSEALASDHAQARKLIQDARHPSGGTVSVMPQPVRLSGATRAADLSAPRLGEHTQSILHEELGLTDSDYAALHARGVI
jgi:CoA:oxalate CoA-transferase